MATRAETVVTLAGTVVEAGRAIVSADDPTVVRGDGVFETLLVRHGRVCLLTAHLARLARSAAVIGLPDPDLEAWRAAVAVAVEHWAGAEDAVLRLTYGRGRGAAPTAFVTVSELPARVAAARRDGVSAMTVDCGVTVGEPQPWSIAGAKSLSYAMNAAALCHAERLGFDDAVLVSADGWVLEGPRSSVVIADDDGVLVTPPDTLPILAGTTVRALFDAARGSGVRCEERILRVADLTAAQGIWLLSSVTLAARIHTLDGAPLSVTATVPNVSALVDRAVADGASR